MPFYVSPRWVLVWMRYIIRILWCTLLSTLWCSIFLVLSGGQNAVLMKPKAKPHLLNSRREPCMPAKGSSNIIS